MENVYLAVFSAAVGDAIFRTGKDAAKILDRHVASHYHYRAVRRKAVESQTWSLETSRELISVLRRYQRWKEYTKCHREKSGSNPQLRENRSKKNLLLVERLFSLHRMSNFLEEVATHLDDVEPVTGISLAPPNLTEYLRWRKLERQGSNIDFTHCYELQQVKDLPEHDTGWAYPHTITAAFHGIPQLLTVAESTLNIFEPCWHIHTLISRLLRLKREPRKATIHSAVLGEGCAVTFPATCGLALSCLRHPGDDIYTEIIYRMDSATIVNCVVARALSRGCTARDYPWTADQEQVLRSLMYQGHECKIDVLLAGHVDKRLSASVANSEPVTVFNPARFQHLVSDQRRLDKHVRLYGEFFHQGRCRYFVPSQAQSDALSSIMDPDFLPMNFAGPYDQCLCSKCLSNAEEKIASIEKRRDAKVKKIHRVMEDIMSGDNERAYDILGFLREKGHYVLTEDDWLEFMHAKSTYARVAVLNRLNQDKAEKEAWMLNS